MNTYIATFFSHYGAIQFRSHAKSVGFSCTLMPVPRSLSSSCGTCAKYEYATWDTGFMDEALEGIYLLDSQNSFELMFQTKDI
ncbi:MAG: DUF3343 domain-containing protein [Sphaerochaeta sp.]|nr:DUF3343 domain-containing protein [Sphaerochaeta sp.]